MPDASGPTDRQKIWDLIKGEHIAVLITIGKDGAFDSRPMGCLQKEFDGTLWFMTFKGTPKLLEIERDGRVLVSFGRSKHHEFVSLSGCARVVEERDQVRSLWNEGLRVWFPDGPDCPDVALLAVDVEEARAWTKPVSALAYAYYYVRARLTGKAPAPEQIVCEQAIRLTPSH